MNINDFGDDYRKLTPFPGKIGAEGGKPALPEKVGAHATADKILAPHEMGEEHGPC